MLDMFANMTMVAWPMGRFQLSIGYWTLSIELGFYLLAILLFVSGQLHNFRLVCGTGIVMALVGALINWEVPIFYGYLLGGHGSAAGL